MTMPADHPADPDAALVERVRRAVLYGLSDGQGPTELARAAIAAMREEEADQSVRAELIRICEHAAPIRWAQEIADLYQRVKAAPTPASVSADAVEVVTKHIDYVMGDRVMAEETAKDIIAALRAIGWGPRAASPDAKP